MADNAVVHIGENSPEYVAYRLMRDIANAEERGVSKKVSETPATREYILQTYSQCLAVVRHGWTGQDTLKEIPTSG